MSSGHRNIEIQKDQVENSRVNQRKVRMTESSGQHMHYRITVREIRKSCAVRPQEERHAVSKIRRAVGKKTEV